MIKDFKNKVRIKMGGLLTISDVKTSRRVISRKFEKFFVLHVVPAEPKQLCDIRKRKIFNRSIFKDAIIEDTKDAKISCQNDFIINYIDLYLVKTKLSV